MADWTRPFSSSWRWVRVSRSTGYEVAQVDNVTRGTLSVNSDSETFESATVSCIGSLDVGSDFLRCYLDATFEDGTTESICIGTWLVSVPSRDVRGSFESCTAVLDGRLIELAEDGFDAPIVVKKGADPIARAKSICEDCDLTVTMPEQVSATLGANWAFGLESDGDDEGGSKLAAVNSLLNAGGMRAAQTDEWGNVLMRKVATQPYSSPVWTFREGAGATFLADATDERDATDVANVVHAIYESDESTTVGVATDTDPASPYSTVVLGRRKVKNYRYNETATQAKANAKAAELLANQQSVVHRVTMSHVWCGARVGDVVEVDYPSAGISGTFLVRTQSIELGGAGALTTSELRRFER